MVRHLLSKHNTGGIGLEEYQPGCMWSILHILDYHHWHHSKKSSSFRRKHGRGKHATICCRNPETYSFQHFNGGMEECLDSEAVPLLDELQTSKTSQANGIADKTDNISEVAYNQNSEKSWQQKTDSIGHFLGGMGANHIIILPKSEDTARSRLQAPSEPKNSGQAIGDRNLSRGLSCPQLKECVDVLEIFKMNKNSFADFLNDPVVNSQRNFEVQTSNKRMRLRKSGSFPAADSPHFRYGWPATLEDKQKEIWSFQRGARLHTEDQEQKSAASKFSESSCDDVNGGDPATLESSIGLKKSGWHLSFSSHFKGLKKKMKHVLKESKKETHGATTKRRLIAQENGESKSLEQTNGSDNDLCKGMQRTSSLHDSVGRYSQLFDFTLSREDKGRLYQSKSLKLSNEEKLAPNGYSLKSFGRRLSLSDLDSLFPLPIDAPRDSFYLKMPIKSVRDCKAKVEADSCNGLTSLSIPGKQVEQVEAIEETELLENIVEAGNSRHKKSSGDLVIDSDEKHTRTVELHQDIAEPGNDEQIPHLDEVTCSTMNSSRQCEDQSTASVLDTSFRVDVNDPTELPVSGGLELDPDQHICIHEAVDLQDRPSNEFVAALCISEDPESANITTDNHFHHFESNRLDDSDFTYTADVLEVSGFTEQDNLEKWYSLDQPLNPALFKELEMHLHQAGPEFSYHCDHRLLFDLINEKLLEIYETSLAYFPETFSFTQRGRRAPPKGNRVVEEVWKQIEKQRSLRSEMEALDDIVSHDMAKKNGWMNVEMDAEDVALELEDWIFSELLDEIM